MATGKPLRRLLSFGAIALAASGFVLLMSMPTQTLTATEKQDAVKTPAVKTPAVKDTADARKLPPRRILPRRKGEISFDTIMFEMDKNESYEPSMVTKEIRALENKSITIRGFILPASVFQQIGIKQFVLVRDNQECCFGPGAALYDCIMVKMLGESSASFSTRPVAVTGKFHVTEKYKYPDKTYMAIYELEATEVK